MTDPRLLSALVACLVSLSPVRAQVEYEWLTDECPTAFNLTGVAKTLADGAKAKIVLGYTSRDEHLAVAFTPTEVKAVRVAGGQATPLWPAGKVPQATQHAFNVKQREKSLSVVVDGRLIGKTEVELKPGARVGASADKGAGFEGLRLQEVEPVYFTDDFMRTGAQTGEWETVSGKWRARAIEATQVDAARSANPFSYATEARETSLAVTGYWFWDEYLHQAAVRPEASGAVGLVVYFQDPKNYVLFRWFSADAEQGDRARQLVYVRDGREHIAAVAAGGCQAGQWYRLTVKATDAQLLGFIDGEQVFAVQTPPFCGGKIGLYAEKCKLASFDDVVCRHWTSPADDPSPRLEAPRVTPRFALEDSMKEWANPDYDWEQGDDHWWWHRGEFWGDASLAAQLPAPAGAPATAAFTIHATKEQADSGYTLFSESAADGASLAYRLTRQGKELGRGTYETGDWPVSLELRRHGKRLLVDFDGQRVLSVEDGKPLLGTGSAIKTSGQRIPTDQIWATGANYLDDTFTSAPVNWWQAKGTWHVTNRWHCSPQWSWMAGTKSVAPILWSKRALAGDFVVEAYVCNKMEQLDRVGYTHPGDMNLTVCGDGRDLGSGYSFVYAGWNNTASGMFRLGRECAPRNKEAVLTDATSKNRSFHRHWFNLRVERRGNELRHWVDGELIGKFEDPEPLPSGRVALWTVGNDQLNNGLVVARTRLWYQRAAPAKPFPTKPVLAADGDPWQARLEPVPDDATTVCYDFEKDAGQWSGYGRVEGARATLEATTAASGKQSLRIENPGSGGDFTVWAGVGAFEATKLPRLRFAYRLPPEVKVNLYVKVGTSYHALEFSGGPQPPGTCPTLGKLEGIVADDQWHTAEFDLGAALREALPDRDSWRVDRICFSAPKETYYRAGIGGNGWGAAWHLDDFELSVR